MRPECWIIPLLLLLQACSSPNIDNSLNLEGDSIRFESLTRPEAYLVSRRDSAPSDSLKAAPVIIAVHGYSATPFEWEEFRDYADSLGGVQVSLVLLGGHGENYETFRKATWRDWQKPIIEEFTALQNLGYKRFHFVCSSTGCPLLLEAMHSRRARFDSARVTMIDPIVFPANKLLTLADLVGPLIGNVEAECTDSEKPYWYCNRPQESLNQLLDLLGITRDILEDGYRLPAGVRLRVYKSLRDDAADPASALMLYQGLNTADGGKIEVRLVNSALHVFTRGSGRAQWSAADATLQKTTFRELWEMSF